MKGKEFVINSEGVRIKKCCASCDHKAPCNDINHCKCALAGRKVPKDYLCRDWRIAKRFDTLKIVYNNK